MRLYVYIALFLFFLILLRPNLYSQSVDTKNGQVELPSPGQSHAKWRIFYPETKTLKIKFDSSKVVTKINIFPCFIEWRYYPHWSLSRELLKKWDSLYLKRKNKNDSISLLTD